MDEIVVIHLQEFSNLNPIKVKVIKMLLKKGCWNFVFVDKKPGYQVRKLSKN